ncbi:MAG TPA: RNA methyltransferase [Candidatus Binatus sp.]|uniref:RNA methyltransferase n=1 Tax=Candidatus Binatus sp. TaxID=2811406 RepID=UPI002B4708E1|nr:RNA methyltransferase [Candidatus Binatus sp.]HKN14460.1 RNA methyltransferase [Candidatus Binatus sp.]
MASREKFAFVLFRPQSAGNIGAAARALKNMGFDDLRLVAPGTLKSREAAAMAVHADDVLARATVYPDLAAALADCSVAVGTTGRRGGYRSRAYPLRAAAAELDAIAGSNKIAIVFGREDRGLTNRELKLCNRLITIPTAPEYPSLNLAQAVVVVAYELMMAAEIEAARAPHFVAAAISDPMLARMEEALVSIGFIPDDNPDHIMFAIREILGRSGLTAREVEILNGMARQMRWVAEGGHRTLAEKRRAGKKLR